MDLARALVVSLVVSAAGCGAEPTSPVEAPPDVVLRVRFAERGPRVGRLIGWNIGSNTRYAPEGDARHPEWRTPLVTEAIAKLGEIRAKNGDTPVFRFSGQQIDGSFGGDGYHFFHYAAPSAPAAPDDNMAPYEWLAIAREAGGEPWMTVNFASGTAREAAEYVRHLDGTLPNDPFVEARAAHGASEPYGVYDVEIGNESYAFWNTGFANDGAYSYANPSAKNGGDPAWAGKPSSNAANFAARAVEYLAAMKAEAPALRARIPLSQSSMDGWGGPDAAVAALSPVLSDPSVAAAVVHQYAIDDGLASGLASANDVAYVLSYAERLRPAYASVRASLDAVARDVPLDLAVTEYHVAATVPFGNFSLGDSPVIGLGIAEALLLFAETGMPVALQHMTLDFVAHGGMLSRAWHIPFRVDDGRLVPMPSYVVTKLVADHLLRWTAPVDVLAMPTGADELGPDAGTLAFPIVHAVAFASEAADEGTLLLLARDLDAPHRASIDVGAMHVDGAEVYAPPSLDASVVDADVVPAALPYSQEGTSVSLALPPHSLAALHLSR